MKAALRFPKQVIADINTAYLEPADRDRLLDPQCPGHLANADDGNAALFRIVSDPVELQDALAGMTRLGLSPRFRAIIAQLHALEILYVWFSPDGGAVEGLERRPHEEPAG